MRTKLMIGLTTLALTAGSLGLAYAHERGEGGGHMEKRLERMAEKLELTDEQREQLRALMIQPDERQTRREAHRDLRRQLHELDPDAPDYQVQLDDLIEQAQQLLGERLRERAEQRAALLEILTDEQEEKMDQWHQKRLDKMHKRHHHHGDW